MFINRPVQPTALDEVIANALKELAGHEAHSAEYAKIVEQLVLLNSMKSNEKTDRVSKDTLALVLGNLAGIIVIVGYEQKHVLTSKALSLLSRAR